MATRFCVLILVLSLLLAAHAYPQAEAGESPVDPEVYGLAVTIEPWPTRTLVAFPVAWTIRILNHNPSRVFVGTRVFLGAVGEDGTVTYNPWYTTLCDESTQCDEKGIRLGPGETREFTIGPLSWGSESRFLRPDPLYSPGMHRMVAMLASDSDIAGTRIVSGVYTLEVLEPVGEDAAVLELVQDLRPNGILGLQWGALPVSLKRAIDENYPTSVYNQLIAPFVSPGAIDRMIGLAQESAWLPMLKIERADQLAQEGARAVLDGNQAVAERCFHQAEALLSELETDRQDQSLSRKKLSLQDRIRALSSGPSRGDERK